jgi:hypothetical protein
LINVGQEGWFRVQEIRPAERVRREKVDKVDWRLEYGIDCCGSPNCLTRIIGSHCRYRVEEIEIVEITYIRCRNGIVRRKIQIGLFCLEQCKVYQIRLCVLSLEGLFN